MKTNQFLILAACSALLVGCATTTPHELTGAREAYQRASAGEASQVAPVELHKANEALQIAERSFADKPKSFATRDLAYVAMRKAEIAEATASIAIEQKRTEQAQADLQKTQAEMVTTAQQALSKSKTALAESEHRGEMAAERLSNEQEARATAEREAALALAKLAAVKEEARGLVLTLSGSVLFASNQSTLLPAAQTRLNQVADALLINRDRSLIIEGHTDSQGSDSHNMALSQSRADRIRDLLVNKGYAANLIQARGMGEGTPVSDNNNAEGRANNRRVEIIIEPEQRSSNQ